jgi:hypothetical protein
VSGSVIFLIALVLAAIVAIAVVAHKIEQKRLLDLQQLAQRLGLSFDPESNYSLGFPYDHFGAFTRGHSRRAYNTITGSLTIESLACAIWMGDYQFKETIG